MPGEHVLNILVVAYHAWLIDRNIFIHDAMALNNGCVMCLP